MSERGFVDDFKKFFGRGLAILLPSVLTLWILWQLAVFVYSNVGAPINRGIRLTVLEIMPLAVGDGMVERELPDRADGEPVAERVPGENVPAWYVPTDVQIRAYLEQQAVSGFEQLPPRGTEAYERRFERGRKELRRELFRRWWNDHWYLEAAGLVLAIILIYLAGMLLGNLIGRKIYGRLERGLSKVPGFKQIYPHVKQVVDLIIGEKKMAFNRAVLVQWPSKGSWTVGLLTGESMDVIRRAAGGECVSVFVPSTPTPFTGFTITYRAEDVIELPISIDQAIRYIITAGVLNKDAEAPGQGVRPEGAEALTRAPARRGEEESESLASGDGRETRA